MKIQDFLIGIGVFALFTIVIFSAINPNNSLGPYGEPFLNITHIDEVQSIVSNISSVGESVDTDYTSIRGDVQGGEGDDFDTGDLSEASFFKAAWRTIKSIPTSYKPVANVLRMLETKIGIPKQFTTWMMSAIVIMVGLMIVTAFLRNRLQS